jgi:hypothetical protein
MRPPGLVSQSPQWLLHLLHTALQLLAACVFRSLALELDLAAILSAEPPSWPMSLMNVLPALMEMILISRQGLMVAGVLLGLQWNAQWEVLVYSSSFKEATNGT